jgi:hypothetical protein
LTVARVISPGFAFAVVSDRGFVIGLHTHRDKQMGYLIWLSTRTYNECPTLHDARAVISWRWCVFYPLGAAINRSIDIPIGQIDVPVQLAAFPRMRAGGWLQPWFEYKDGKLVDLRRPCTDPTLPIRMIVNDTRLKEMIVTDWRPEDDW